MICVVQRVDSAGVTIGNKMHGKIGKGLLILAGICKGDNEEAVKTSAKKITDLRIFTDEDGKMNLNVKDIGGEILIISQFTLCSDKAKSGNRPSFINAEEPEKAEVLYNLLVSEVKSNYSSDKIQTGIFAAKMKVELLNDGPVTIILEK